MEEQDSVAGLIERWRRGDPRAAVLINPIADLLRDQSLLHGQIREMRLQGHGRPDIALRLGVSGQTVYRALNLLQQRLEHSRGEEG